MKRFEFISFLAVLTTFAILTYHVTTFHAKQPQIVLINTDTANVETIEDALMYELIYRGCILPNVAIAQFRIETAHYSSRIFIECNNVAGIRTSKSPLVKGMKYGHCVYDSVEDSVQDYIDIQNRYLTLIDGSYAESTEYIDLIKKMK
jgi:uncharacterized FlgJ-related protein